MRFLDSVFILSLTVAFPACSWSREAELLDFKSALPEFAETAGGQVAAVPSNIVAQSMLVRFDDSQIADGGRYTEVATSNRAAFPSKSRSVPGRFIGRYSSIPPLPDIPGGLVRTFKSEGKAYCDGASYDPTWWLSREVEARRAKHFSTIAAIACEFGIPTHLLDAVVAQESGYKYWAVSSAGAMGMMQIMPGTARILNLALPFEPVSNLRAGARYLRQQIDRFGRVDLALSAYNAGPERRSLQRGYIPAIPETLNYVRTITTNWARLTELGNGQTDTTDRTYAALAAVHASGYRDVELIRYDGLN